MNPVVAVTVSVVVVILPVMVTVLLANISPLVACNAPGPLINAFSLLQRVPSNPPKSILPIMLLLPVLLLVAPPLARVPSKTKLPVPAVALVALDPIFCPNSRTTTCPLRAVVVLSKNPAVGS